MLLLFLPLFTKMYVYRYDVQMYVNIRSVLNFDPCGFVEFKCLYESIIPAGLRQHKTEIFRCNLDNTGNRIIWQLALMTIN